MTINLVINCHLAFVFNYKFHLNHNHILHVTGGQCVHNQNVLQRSGCFPVLLYNTFVTIWTKFNVKGRTKY